MSLLVLPTRGRQQVALPNAYKAPWANKRCQANKRWANKRCHRQTKGVRSQEPFWQFDHFASCRSPSLLSGLGGVLPLRLAKETAAEFGQMGSPSHSILLLETVVPRADADQEVDKAGDAS